jgi:hypothetical protein
VVSECRVVHVNPGSLVLAEDEGAYRHPFRPIRLVEWLEQRAPHLQQDAVDGQAEPRERPRDGGSLAVAPDPKRGGRSVARRIHEQTDRLRVERRDLCVGSRSDRGFGGRLDLGIPDERSGPADEQVADRRRAGQPESGVVTQRSDSVEGREPVGECLDFGHLTVVQPREPVDLGGHGATISPGSWCTRANAVRTVL